MAANTRDGQRDKLKKDLVSKINAVCPNSPAYLDLVEDYLSLWDDKQMLREDINGRGRKVTKYDSRGQQQTANNESIDQIIKINSQMLNIIKALGIEPSQIGGIDGETPL